MDNHTDGVRMGILEIVALPGGPDLEPQAAVVLEDEIVVDGLPDVPSAFAVLYCSLMFRIGYFQKFRHKGKASHKMGPIEPDYLRDRLMFATWTQF